MRLIFPRFEVVDLPDADLCPAALVADKKVSERALGGLRRYSCSRGCRRFWVTLFATPGGGEGAHMAVVVWQVVKLCCCPD
jgi:hypothetical protein